MSEEFQLRTGRLLIRSFSPADIDPLAAISANPNVMRYMGYGHTVPPAAVRDYIERYLSMNDGTLPEWGVERLVDGIFVGRCGFGNCVIDGVPEVEFGYMLGEAYWGQGYGTELARALVRYGLEVLNLPRLIAMTHPDNTASARVIRKAGLTYEKRVVLPKGPRLIFGIARGNPAASR